MRGRRRKKLPSNRLWRMPCDSDIEKAEAERLLKDEQKAEKMKREQQRLERERKILADEEALER